MGLAAVGLRVVRLSSRAAHSLATVPNATLRVSGSACSRLVVKTNMETYVATVEASSGGAQCSDEEVAAWASSGADGDLTVRVGADVATVSVPACFNVEVAMEGSCDVSLDGWLEGTVDVAVDGRGSVGVNTVRGLLTRVRTGGGDVDVKHVEGNLEVVNGDAGSVTCAPRATNPHARVRVSLCGRRRLQCTWPVAQPRQDHGRRHPRRQRRHVQEPRRLCQAPRHQR
jgi:hypothetical protein